MHKEQVLALLKQEAPNAKIDIAEFGITLEVPSSDWLSTIEKLYNSPQLKLKKLKVLTVRANTFLWAELGSELINERVSISCPAPSSENKIPSIQYLWPLADWFEREIFSVWGIKIEGAESP